MRSIKRTRRALVERLKVVFRHGQPPEISPGSHESLRGLSSANIQLLASTPSANLESLPPELRCQILSSLPTLDDLKSAVYASPVLYQQYRQDRKPILDSVLRRTLGDKVVVDAYAVQKSAPMERPPYLAADLAIQVFMMEYQEYYTNPSVVSGACAVGDLIGMAAFYSSTIQPLLQRVPAMLLRNLDRSLQPGPLSKTEQARILRALYRFQLWCNLHGTSDIAAARDRAVDPVDMLKYFFEVFEPWETEEISCIHELFLDLYDRIFAKIRWDFDRHSIRFVNSPLGDKPDGSIDLGHDEYSEGNRRALQAGVVSRGLQFHLKVLRTQHHKELVQRMQPVLSAGFNSIEHPLKWDTQRMRRDLHPSDRDRAQSNGDRMPFKRDHEVRPPLAWVVLWRGRYNSWFGGRIPVSLKRWGYVFWDCRRLNTSRGKDVVLRVWPTQRRRRRA